MSLTIVFLCLSGLFLIFKNAYRNTKTKTLKGFYAKYHRLILLYTLPLLFIFGLSGTVINLGLYTSPIITNYLSNGKTSNLLRVPKNILQDPPLKSIPLSQEIKSLSLNTLYLKAKKEFDDIEFYAIETYNYNDINSRIKFIAYEPKNFFVSALVNETYIVLSGVDGKVLDKKIAQQGTLAEKALDSVFYLHYLNTFADMPRFIFAIICIFMLFGLISSLMLWFERVKKENYIYVFMKPIIFTILLGSLISSCFLFATNWFIKKEYYQFELLEKSFITHEVLFYISFIFVFIFIKYINNLHIVSKYSFLISCIFLLIAVLSHNIISTYNIFNTYSNELKEVFYVDLALLIISICFYLIYKFLPEKYFEFERKIH